MSARVTILTALCLLAGAAPAAAATVTSSGGVITYQAAAGEKNTPSADVMLDPTQLVVTGGTPGSGCTGSEYVPDTAYCALAGVTKLRFLLGDGDDGVVIGGSIPAGITTFVELGGFLEQVQSVTNHAPGPLEVAGGPGPDSVTSFGDAEDTVVSHGGDDQVRTNGGDDVVDLGAGDDEAHTGGGADMVDGGDGADLIYGDAGGDLMFGGAGDDDLWGELGSDILDGEDGNDRVQGDASFEMGAFEDDELHGGPGWDTADFGPRGGLLPVTVSLDGVANDGAEGENDNVGPNGDIERVEGSGNDDVLIGNDGPNELYGDFGDDDLDGRGGDDWLDGFAGSDRLAGGAGNDLVEGGSEDDALLGEDGDDRTTGGTGNDTIDAGPGADVIEGGPDSDMLLARDGTGDSVFCAGGVDTAEVDAVDTFVDQLFCENVLLPAGTGGPGGGGSTTTPPPAAPTGIVPLTLSVNRKQSLAAARRTGVRVSTRAPGSGRVEATLLLARKAAKRVRLAAATPVMIGRKALTVSAARDVVLRVKLTRKAKARLRRARTVKPIVRVTFTDSAGARSSVSRKITLRR